MNTCYYLYMESPVGVLRLVQKGNALSEVLKTEARPDFPAEEKETALLKEVKKQLNEYFLGIRKTFDVPMEPEGTEFQKRAWQTLLTIPYGECISYGEEARRMGCKCARAVGSANGRNPICILIPCHRVVRTGGFLGGYAYGIQMKQFLLELENRNR